MTQHMSQYTVNGAYITLDDLIAAQAVAKNIRPKWRKTTASLIGSNLSNYRNRGLEFEEVRLYQAGDDIRNIDWRVTARSGGETYTKLFKEERERPLLLCVDQRLSSFIGSQCCFKSALSAHIAALLGWSGLQQKDRVGGIIFNDNTHNQWRPRSSRKNLLLFLQDLSKYNNQLNRHVTPSMSLSQSLNQALKELQHISHTGSTIFIISDFAGLDQQALDSLTHIARHNSVCCIQIADHIEQQLPAMQQAQFFYSGSTLKLNTHSQEFQSAYKDEFIQRQSYIKNSFKKYAIPYFLCMTHQPPIETLQQHLQTNKSMRR